MMNLEFSPVNSHKANLLPGKTMPLNITKIIWNLRE